MEVGTSSRFYSAQAVIWILIWATMLSTRGFYCSELRPIRDQLPLLEEPQQQNIIDTAILIDGHNDFAIWTRAFYHNHIYEENFTLTSEIYGQVDFPRLKEGRLGGQFWSVYVEWWVTTKSPARVHNNAVTPLLLQHPHLLTCVNTSHKQYFSPSVPNVYSDESYYEIIHDTLQQIDLV